MKVERFVANITIAAKCVSGYDKPHAKIIAMHKSRQGDPKDATKEAYLLVSIHLKYELQEKLQAW